MFAAHIGFMNYMVIDQSNDLLSCGWAKSQMNDVVVIEYRVSVKGTMKSTPSRKQQPNQMEMIRHLLAQNQKQDKTNKK